MSHDALQISAVLALACGANWAAFDGTRTGIILGALLAVGAPLSEAFIVNVLGWWHYDRPDFLGVVHWSGALAFQLIINYNDQSYGRYTHVNSAAPNPCLNPG